MVLFYIFSLFCAYIHDIPFVVADADHIIFMTKNKLIYKYRAICEDLFTTVNFTIGFSNKFKQFLYKFKKKIIDTI
jgi:hypothetical protein